MADTSASFPDLGPKVAASRHPIYDIFEDEWIKLGNVREGTGGFKDGTYLIAHPREWEDHNATNPKKPTKKLKARRALAKYENLASSILETKKSSLFRESPNRRIGTGESPDDTHEIEAWWDDVDGARTHIDDAMPLWWDLAATFGHIVLYFELPPSGAVAETAADEPLPYVRIYTPLDIINWLVNDNGEIVSIKVIEAVQATDYTQMRPVTQYRVRVIDDKGWRVYDQKTGTGIEQGEHQLGRVPFVFLYGKRRAILSDVGQSVLGDPRNYIDLFNLRSELRELLRNQTFSFLNVPLGSGVDAMSVETAQSLIGAQTGTANVLFSGLPAQMLTADAANVAAYQEEIQSTLREIYRDAGVQWEADGKGVEATGSLELKREELNTRLSAYADECQQTEYQLVDLWYRFRYGADQGPATLEKDEVSIHYPERFSATPFVDVLAEVQSAQTIGMPTEVMKTLRKALLSKFEGMANLPPDQLQALLDAIDSAADDPTPMDRMQARAQVLAGGGKPGEKAAKDGSAPPKKEPTKQEPAAA